MAPSFNPSIGWQRWQRHIGVRTGVTAAIVVGRDAAGNILFIFPLSIRPVCFARELAWLGSDLCDYNAPLLATDFSELIDRARFMALWEIMMWCLESDPHLQFDYVNLPKCQSLAAINTIRCEIFA